MTPLSIAVVIPAKNAGEYLVQALQSILAQLRAGDEVIIVDDCSSEWPDLPEHEAIRTLHLPKSVGPYEARNIASRAASTDLLLFFDVRCRARPGWLEAHRSILASRSSFSYTDVAVDPGNSTAGRAVSVREPFSIRNYAGSGYFPTCNLGVTASAFRMIGGFAAVRSGGDAELCWRLTSTLGLRGAADSRVLVDWTPRESVQSVFAQFRRYGGSFAELNALSRAGRARRLVLMVPRLLKRGVEAWRVYPRDIPVLRVALGIQASFEVGAFTGRASTRESVLPRGLSRLLGERL